MTFRRLVVIAVGCIIISVVGLTLVQGQPKDDLPESVLSSLKDLQTVNPDSLAPADAPAGMRVSALVKGRENQIQDILKYCGDSGERIDKAAARVLAFLSVFSQAYGPGASINPALLAKTEFELNDIPDAGISLHCYLLLELSKRRRSSAFTKEALSACRDAVAAESNLWQQAFLTRVPTGRSEIERGEREFGGFLTSGGAEVAWCCEALLADVASKPPDYDYLTPGSTTIARQYVEWRTSNRHGDRDVALPDYLQHRTMEWVEKMIRALPQQ